MGNHEFETIFNSNDVMNIQYGIDKVLRSRERAYSMVVNDNFFPRQTNIPHAKPNYGPRNLSLKFIITDRHLFLN